MKVTTYRYYDFREVQPHVFHRGNGRRVRTDRNAPMEVDVAESSVTHEMLTDYRAYDRECPSPNPDVLVAPLAHLPQGKQIGLTSNCKVINIGEHWYLIANWSTLFGYSVKEGQLGLKVGTDRLWLYLVQLNEEQEAWLEENALGQGPQFRHAKDVADWLTRNNVSPVVDGGEIRLDDAVAKTIGFRSAEVDKHNEVLVTAVLGEREVRVVYTSHGRDDGSRRFYWWAR